MKKTNRSPRDSQNGVGHFTTRSIATRGRFWRAGFALSAFGLGIPESAEAAEEGFVLFSTFQNGNSFS